MTLRINQVGESKFQIIENADGRDTILRTLPTKEQADGFAVQLGHNPNRKK